MLVGKIIQSTKVTGSGMLVIKFTDDTVLSIQADNVLDFYVNDPESLKTVWVHPDNLNSTV